MTPRDDYARTVIVTGASSGIGRAIALGVAERDLADKIVLIGRDRSNLDAALLEIERLTATECDVEVCDFVDLSSVAELADRLADRYSRMTALFSNAGLLAQSHRPTLQGFETTWQVNYLAGFLLAFGLKNALHEGRIVVTASHSYRNATLAPGNHEKDVWDPPLKWNAGRSYANSKLANIMMVREMARRWGVNAYSFHPGEIRTHFGRNTLASPYFRWNPFLRSAQKGADTAVWLLQTPEENLQPGGYYFDRQICASPVMDAEFERRLWDITENRLNLREVEQ